MTSPLIIKDYEDKHAHHVYDLWRDGFFEMRADGFAWLCASPLYHIFNLCWVFLLFYLFNLGLSFSLVATIVTVGLDFQGIVKSVSWFMSRLHAFIFWHLIGLLGRKDMRTPAALRKYWDIASFSHFWVAELDGIPVACIACRLTHTLLDPAPDTPADEASVWRLSVSPNARRHGLGKLLMRQAEEWAASYGAKHMSLITGNIESKQFYRRIGYRIESEDRAKRICSSVKSSFRSWFLIRSLQKRLHPQEGTVFVKAL